MIYIMMDNGVFDMDRDYLVTYVMMFQAIV